MHVTTLHALNFEKSRGKSLPGEEPFAGDLKMAEDGREVSTAGTIGTAVPWELRGIFQPALVLNDINKSFVDNADYSA
jgi:hypothetical protein